MISCSWKNAGINGGKISLVEWDNLSPKARTLRIKSNERRRRSSSGLIVSEIGIDSCQRSLNARENGSTLGINK